MAISDTITGLESYPILFFLHFFDFGNENLSNFIDAFVSLDALNAYLGINFPRWLLAPIVYNMPGLFSPWPLVTGWFELIIDPIIFLLLIILPDDWLEPSKQGLYLGLFLMPLNLLTSIPVHRMEISLGWLYWIGFDLYTKADTHRKKLAFLYLEYWFYLPWMMFSDLLFIP